MNIAVLMTCHNRCEKTIDCLRHLYDNVKNDNLSYEVFLVDDACTDDTPKAVRNNYPDVHLINGDGTLFWNRGMCLAWETAVEVGNFDGYLWLNDDTMLNKDALAQLYALAIKHPNSNIVGTVCSSDMKCITYGGFQKGKIITPNGSLQYCDKFNGNIVFIPTSVTKIVGFMDSYYRHSKGDSDYAIRTNLAGLKNIVGPIIGTCDRNPIGAIWNKGNIIQRYKKLYSPLGNNPFEMYHICKKTSTLRAIWVFIYIHIRVLFSFVIPQSMIKKYIIHRDKRYSK